jgi:TatD DNase family protein
MMLVDSHCHLNYPPYNQGLNQYILRAKQAGIGYFLTISTELSKCSEIMSIAEQYQEVFCSVGTHPHEASQISNKISQTEEIVLLSNHPKVIGIGECGLDFFYMSSNPVEQISIFQDHINAAQKTQLPLIIHTRDAEKQTIDMLSNTQISSIPVSGVLHCFTGTETLARAALDLGFYLSISGIVTFKNAQELRDIVRWIPDDRLLLETDAPFLAPVPHRGKQNEPAFLLNTAELVANIRNTTLDKLSQSTTENFFRLFQKANRVDK